MHSVWSSRAASRSCSTNLLMFALLTTSSHVAGKSRLDYMIDLINIIIQRLTTQRLPNSWPIFGLILAKSSSW